MKLVKTRTCPSVHGRSKKNRNWDGAMKKAEQLLNNLQSSDENSDKPGAPVLETRKQRIRSAEKKVKTLGEVLELLKALVENLAAGDALSLQEAERSVERKSHQNSRPCNNNNQRERRTDLTRNLEATVYRLCPICGKRKHEKTITNELEISERQTH